MKIVYETLLNFLIKNTVSKPHSLSFLVTYKTYEEAFDYLDTKTGEEVSLIPIIMARNIM